VAQIRVDWLLVAHLASATATASYSLVNRAYEVLMMLIGTGAMTLFPMLCRANDSTHDGVGVRAFRKAVLAAGVLASGGAALLLPGFCVWVWHDKYPGADVLFAMLMPVACLSTFIQAMYYEAVAKRAEARLVTLGIVSTIAQFAVNVTLIPRLGPAGAVAGMLTLAVANITFYFWQRNALHLPSLADMMRLAVYAIGMGVLWLVVALTVPTLTAQLAVGGAAWVVVTLVCLLEPPERRAIKSWVRAR
jgi:O-antigen/teichoic acid export membrane protein